MSEHAAFQMPRWAAIVIIALVAFGVYANSLLNGFVFDDSYQVLQNPWIKDTSHLREIFTSGVWKFRDTAGNYYRPVMHLINVLNYRIFGLHPWGFHLTNVILHTITSLLVFIIALGLFRETRTHYPFSPAFVTAVLFATHPIHTEAVSWIAGLPDLSFSLFYLLAFLLYIRATSDGRVTSPLKLTLSAVSFFLSALCKEPALTLPAVMFAYDFAFFGPGALRRTGDLAKRYLPFAAAAILYGILRLNALRGFVPFREPEGLTSLQYVLSTFPLFVQYLGKLIMPIRLNAYYEFHPVRSFFEAKAILAIVTTLGFLACTIIIAMKKSRTVFFYLAAIVLPLLPALYIKALPPGTKFGERYLYLSVFGFGMLIARGLERLGSRGRRGTGAVIVLVLVTGFYAVSTIQRNTVWKDNYSLFSDTVNKSPNSPNAHNNLGAAYGKMGLTDKAIEQYLIALRLKPDHPDIHNNLGTGYLDKGWYDKALEQFQEALRLNPRHAGAHEHMGDVYSHQGSLDLAIRHYKEALLIKGDSPSLYNKLGLAYGRKGLLEEAAEEFRMALRLDPDSVMARNNLGVVYARMGIPDKAIEQFTHVLGLYPNAVDTLKNISKAYDMKGMPDEAAYYERRARDIQQSESPGTPQPSH